MAKKKSATSDISSAAGPSASSAESTASSPKAKAAKPSNGKSKAQDQPSGLSISRNKYGATSDSKTCVLSPDYPVPDIGDTSPLSTVHGCNYPTRFSRPSLTATTSPHALARPTLPSSTTCSRSASSSTKLPTSPSVPRMAPPPQLSPTRTMASREAPSDYHSEEVAAMRSLVLSANIACAS